MSEQAPRNPEQNRHAHEAASSKEHRKAPASKEVKRHSKEDVEKITSKVHEAARSTHETPSAHSETSPQETPTWTNASMQKQGFANTMRTTRRKLGSFDKIYSHAIHHPVVESISETSSKTITRPKPLLFGALTSLLGSIYVLYYAKRSGFEVQPSLFIILFTAGYVAGFLLDFIFSSIQKLNRK